MLTTRMYLSLLGSVSFAAVAVAGTLTWCHAHAQTTPSRPHQVSAQAVWRSTPSDSVALAPHGDWIACSGAGDATHCTLTDASGTREFEGTFQTLPEVKRIASTELRPVSSENLSPWMWSPRLQRMVPIIHLEDGTVLGPKESAGDLRAYVAQILKFTTEHLRPVPVYAAEEQPRASIPDPSSN